MIPADQKIKLHVERGDILQPPQFMSILFNRRRNP